MAVDTHFASARRDPVCSKEFVEVSIILSKFQVEFALEFVLDSDSFLDS